MKNIKTKLAIFTLFFTIGLLSQNIKQKPWNNHENYKEELINNIKKSNKQLVNEPSKTLQDTEKKTNTYENRVFSNFNFVNGINIAWVQFGRDIGKESNGTEYHPNLNTFSGIMDQVKNAGGNVIRWWYHTNGSTNPVFDNNGLVAENPDFFKTDLLAILNLAASKGIKVQICLWSFDMLKGGQWNVNSTRNKNIITSNTHFQAYLDNALIPLVNAVGNHPGLYAWEIFNEPEGMTLQYASHWSGFTDRVTITEIQAMINKTTSAIKTAQPNVKVTNGALGFTSSIDNNSNGYINQYTDQKLIAAGGKANGVLDFYNIHYYDWAGTTGSPFHNDFNNVNLDKPTVIAEYYPTNTFGISSANLGTTLIQRGWNGSLVWSITDRSWDDMKPIVENIYQQLQTNTPPPPPPTASTCTTVSNTASNFVITNSWSDQNIGSNLSNSNGDLVITHRQWGKTDLSLISASKYPIVAGKTYTISFDFRDNQNAKVNKIEVGFANGYSSSGANILQPITNSTDGFLTSYKTHTATITASTSGQVNLALKLILSNQPSTIVSYSIKNIKICELQNNTPPITACSTVSNATSNFNLTNAWSDQNIGSNLSNSNGDLVITHRQWGKTDLSLISTAKYPVVAGKTYTISFDFRDNQNAKVNKIEVGFANGFSSSGANLLQPIVNSTAGFLTSYKTHTATITASTSGQVNLALKLILNNQPSTLVNYSIKNIKICETNTTTNKIESNLSDVESKVELFPNPTTGKFSLQVPANSAYKIFDLSGKVVNENNNALPLNEINLESYQKGMYLIRIIINDEKEVYKKIIIQ